MSLGSSGPEGRTVLVTGAGGFVGQETCRQLLAVGWRVRGMVHRQLPASLKDSPVEIVRGDIRDPAVVESAIRDVQCVVHLAARKKDEADSFEVNVEGVRLLIDVATKSGVGRLVNVSTQAATYRRRDRYGLSKAAADELVYAAPIDSVTLIPSLVYGDDQTGVFAKLRDTVRKLPVVPVLGDGSAMFQPIHVADLAAVIVAAATAVNPQPSYFVGGPDPLTFDQIIDLAEGTTERRKRRVHLPWTPLLWGAHLLRRLFRAPPVTVSNVLGASSQNQEIHDITPVVSDLGVHPRRMEDWARDPSAE